MSELFLSNFERMRESLKNNKQFDLSLKCLEQNEQFAHNRSIVMSEMSNLLTVAQSSWAKWANRSQSLNKVSDDFEQMSDD